MLGVLVSAGKRAWLGLSLLLGQIVSFSFSSPGSGAQAAGRGQWGVCEVDSWGSNSVTGDEAVVGGVWSESPVLLRACQVSDSHTDLVNSPWEASFLLK